MQGEQLLKDPDFAQTLAKSPFKAKDLPGLSSAVSDTFQRMPPELRASMREAVSQLEKLPAQQLMGFFRLLSFVEKNPEQYPRLVAQLEKSEAFDRGELPAKYNPTVVAITKAVISQAIAKVQSRKPVPGYAKGGLASLKNSAEDVRSAGRNGDTMLAHINPFEASMLKDMGGAGTINPQTGLPEFGIGSVLGKILKIGAQVVATAVLTPFVGPIAAGAIVGGVSSLLSGAKPADALKSAIIGGTLSGIGAGFSGSGSFSENAFAGGSLFGSGPAASPLLDAMKGTSVGNSLFGNINTAGSAASGSVPLPPEPSKFLTSADYGTPAEAAAAEASGRLLPAGVAPTIAPPAAATAAEGATSGLKGIWDNYKLPIMLGGGAALIMASQAEKANEKIEPSLMNKVPDTSTGIVPRLDSANFQPQQAKLNPSIFPGGQYVETPIFPSGGYTSPVQNQPNQPSFYDYTKVQYPTSRPSGIMAAVGGAIDGPGTGTSDSIPAKLSDGEFVMTAKAVRGAGNGDRAKGAKKMYGIMHKFERMA